MADRTASVTPSVRFVARTATGAASVTGVRRLEARAQRVGAGRGEGIPFIPTAPPHPLPK